MLCGAGTTYFACQALEGKTRWYGSPIGPPTHLFNGFLLALASASCSFALCGLTHFVGGYARKLRLQQRRYQRRRISLVSLSSCGHTRLRQLGGLSSVVWHVHAQPQKPYAIRCSSLLPKLRLHVQHLLRCRLDCCPFLSLLMCSSGWLQRPGYERNLVLRHDRAQPRHPCMLCSQTLQLRERGKHLLLRRRADCCWSLSPLFCRCSWLHMLQCKLTSVFRCSYSHWQWHAIR